MKALILAAGYATRLRPLTDSIPKMLLPLAERPMLDYLLDRIREVDDLDEIHLVTNARFAGALGDWAPEDVTVHDDGTTSNEDRLGAIGDIAFAIERGGLEGQAPDIDPFVYLTECDPTAFTPGQFVTAEIVGGRDYDLVARPCLVEA